MNTLYVLYDDQCGFCLRCRGWLERQAQGVKLVFVPASSPDLATRFPGLTLAEGKGDLTVVGDDGNVYRGSKALIVCLWALRDYRRWAARLARPSLEPMVRRAFDVLSSNRHSVSKLLRLRTELREHG